MRRTSRNSPAPLTLLQTFSADSFSARSDEPHSATRDPRNKRRWITVGGAAAMTIPPAQGWPGASKENPERPCCWRRPPSWRS